MCKQWLVATLLLFYGTASALPPTPNACAVKEAALAPNWLSHLTLNTKLRKVLENHKKYETQVSAHDHPLAPRPGQTVMHNSEAYKVLSVLGSGSQASVYLVEGAKGKFSLKIFQPNRRYAIAEHNELLGVQAAKEQAEFAEEAVRAPTVYSTDLAKGSVLIQYVEGVPLDTLLEYPKKCGLTEAEVAAIQSKSARFAKKQAYNVILEISTGRFYRIDPR